MISPYIWANNCCNCCTVTGGFPAMVLSVYSVKGGCSSGAKQYMQYVSPHTCKIKTKPPKPFVRFYLTFLIQTINPLLWLYPQIKWWSRRHTYIPLWIAYALQLGSCSAVTLLCGGWAVQGASPYTSSVLISPSALMGRHFG